MTGGKLGVATSIGRDFKTLLLINIIEEDHGPKTIEGFCKEQARRVKNLQTGCQDEHVHTNISN